MPKPPRIKFYVVYKAEDKAWFVKTGKDKEASVSGPYPTKKPALDYAKDRAKHMASENVFTQVLSQEKGKRRWNTEATYPKSSDPRNTKGVTRKPSKKKR